MAGPSLPSMTLCSMRKSLLLVSAHNPVPRLSCTQLSRTSALSTAQNFTPPVHPQPSILVSQSPVLLPTISLPSTTRSVRSPSLYAFMPYCPLSFRQFPRTTWCEPAIIPAPSFFSIVLSSITQPSPESWLTTPSLGGGTNPVTVSPRMVTFSASYTNA